MSVKNPHSVGCLVPVTIESPPASLKSAGFGIGAEVMPDGSLNFIEVSFVANPPDPRARIWPKRTCPACRREFSGPHPDNGCEMCDVFHVMEE